MLVQMPELVRERAGGQSLEASAMLPLNGTTEEVNQLMDDVMAAHAARTASKTSKKVKNGAHKPPASAAAVGISQPAGLDEQQRAGIAVAAANAAEAESRLTSATAAADLKAAIGLLPKKHARSEPPAQGIAAWKLEPSTGLGHAAKKYRAAQHIPDGATKSVYSSIFIGDRQPVKETYSCRATSARGMNIA